MMASICRIASVAAAAAILCVGFTPDVLAGEAEWKAHMDSGKAAYDRGDYQSAAASLAAALKEAEGFGETDRRLAETSGILAHIYEQQQRYAEAEPLYGRSLAIFEKAGGLEYPDVAKVLSFLAGLYRAQGRYTEAEPLYLRTLNIEEKVLGPDHTEVAKSLYHLASLYQVQGRYAETESLYRRSLGISERALGPDHKNVALTLNDLAGLYQVQGRYAEAEPLHRRSLAISEKALGPDHKNVALSLNNLAALYRVQGRDAEAEPLYRRSLTILEKALGPDHTNVALSLNNIGGLYVSQGRYTEADPLYKRALGIFVKTLGPDHPNVALTLNNLAELYRVQGRYAEAEILNRRSLAISEQALGPDHKNVALTLNSLAELYQVQGRYAEAEPLYRRSFQINEKALGPDHPGVGTSLNNLAGLYRQEKRLDEGLALARRATRALAGRYAARDEGGRRAVLSEQRTKSWGFEQHVALLHDAHGGDANSAAEGFEVAQLARASDTAEQVAKMAARYAAGSDSLAQLARARQDAVARLQQIDTQIVQAASREPKTRNAQVEARLRAEASKAKTTLTELDARIDKEFPQYRELTNPRPLSLAEAQKLLGSDEALVVLLVSHEESFLWVVQRDASLFERLAMTRRELDALVKKLRAQLDLGGKDPAKILAQPFDVAAAHELYRKVLAPGEKLLTGVKHLIFVPDGALTSLPLGVLVTELPGQELRTLEQHANVAWLAKKYAITTLPAVGSLRALRAFAKGKPAGEPFLGYGDPVLEGSGNARGRTVAALYSRGAVADATEVRKLARLPETADELKAIGASLGASAGQVRLGPQATEQAVKEANLSRYRTLAFATHGPMAGEFKGLAEPALVLTPPEKGSELDDGLLTAGEISLLKMNADWVILSACNTAAPDGTPGADGLSGLAKAFFYAGARSLLVSHWAVSSEASVALTTRMFTEVEKGAGKAEALRRSMLALMTSGDPYFAHPAFWAPFVVVGEGGAKLTP